ncbi:YfhO family protein [Mesobacillus harenae]|uniref:YfhO family protein n=1 Tax=Mesobacillus harenae TaxID=2213203 RepID=UPI0015805EAA|nr:YfhO family protein [Mesobacillus harenae]
MHKNKINTFLLYCAVFFIPIIIFGVSMANQEIYPFGGKTLLISDMNNQYIEFYAHLHNVLNGEKSLLYSWEAGLGVNFIGIFAYYLASPFSLLIVFFNQDQLPEAIILITLAKIGTSAMTSFWFMNHLYRSRFSTFIFSIIYSLISFNIVYSFNIMWLDGVVFLPVILLGIEKLLKNNDIRLLTLSLALVFIANFYISYMTGLFAAIYFIYRLIISQPSIKLFLKKGVFFFASVFLAAGLASILILPTYMALQNSPNSPLSPDTNFIFLFDLWDLYGKLYNGTYDSLIHGLPNIYAGLFVLVLLPVYFINNKISVKEKLLSLLIAVGLVLSFELTFLNLVWHGFDLPTWFPYRYSFVFSFFIIFLAARVYSVFDKTMNFAILISLSFNLFMIVFLSRFSANVMKPELVWFNILFTIIFSGLLFFQTKLPEKKKVVQILILLAVSLDLLRNTGIMMNEMDSQFGYSSKGSYHSFPAEYEEMILEIQNKDKSFYRMIPTIKRGHNDSFRLGYKGIDHFSSMANGELHHFLNKAGFTALGNYFWVSSTGSTIVTESLFSIKYIASNHLVTKYGYKLNSSENSYYLYENDLYLPIGFMLNQGLLSNTALEQNPFEIQNSLLGSDNGKKEYFQEIMPVKTTFTNLEAISSKDNIQQYKKKTDMEDGQIELKFNLDKNQTIYTHYSGTDAELEVNGKEYGIYPRTNNNGALSLKAEENPLSIRLKFKEQDIILTGLKFYVLDKQLFEKRVTELQNNSFEVLDWSNRSIKGKIDVANENLLFLSIPYDPGWSVTVDGKPAAAEKVFGAFIGIQLDSGEREVELVYTPPGLKSGITVSSLSLLVFIFYCLFRRKSKQK